jgi:nitrate reductase delta subunit
MENKPEKNYQLFSLLFTYPTANLLSEIEEKYSQLSNDISESKQLIDQFRDFVKSISITDLEELYTSTFDVNPVCFPYPGFHVFGENFNRADFLVKLKQKYQEHGFISPDNELADHLPILLQFLSTLNTDDILAQELLEECLIPALEKMREGFKNDHPYGLIIEALWLFCQQQQLISKGERPFAPTTK